MQQPKELNGYFHHVTFMFACELGGHRWTWWIPFGDTPAYI
jgi:hypothetical protein